MDQWEIPISRPTLPPAAFDAIKAVAETGRLSGDAALVPFEEQFASAAVAGRRCLAVNSGTSALLLVLKAAGLTKGDEVILPAFTFVGCANSVLLAGAVPRFVDVDPDTLNIDPDAVTASINPRTAAVLAVHLYGCPAQMDALRSVCRKRSLLLIEDCAQSLGASIGGKPVGTYGDAAVFSFQATKLLTAGEGGMVTGGEDLLDVVRTIRGQGLDRSGVPVRSGFNMRMSGITAAVVASQLNALSNLVRDRRDQAARYCDAFAGSGLHLPGAYPGHAYGAFTIRSSSRDVVASWMSRHRVETRIYYPMPLPYLEHLSRWCTDSYPVATTAAAEVLSLPIGSHLSRSGQNRVTDVLKRCRRV